MSSIDSGMGVVPMGPVGQPQPTEHMSGADKIKQYKELSKDTVTTGDQQGGQSYQDLAPGQDPNRASAFDIGEGAGQQTGGAAGTQGAQGGSDATASTPDNGPESRGV